MQSTTSLFGQVHFQLKGCLVLVLTIYLFEVLIQYFFHRQETEQYEELNREVVPSDHYTSLNIGLDDRQNRYQFAIYLSFCGTDSFFFS